MKNFSTFYPSPYQIKDPWVRQRYKVFLFLIKQFDFEDTFESLFQIEHSDKAAINFFGNKSICKEGYFNCLCGWARYSALTKKLRALEIINHFILWILNHDKIYAATKPYKNSDYYSLVMYGSFKYKGIIMNDIVTDEVVNEIFKIVKEFKKPKKENILIKEATLQDIIEKMQYSYTM